ncbi:unnamed protein product [Diatraea saccharalis]|uniref:Uncharacterized protein n=1 Tax=Diatraea saccharalis TaxID=40085 RepID=A0A9N9RF41_9NEOP|nr:unnamed protein product [Diatraea saccharalis]
MLIRTCINILHMHLLLAMELVSLAKEMLQTVAEQAASYRAGQTLLRWLDRVLWTVEKCARWAVPPPLDQDERPQPELVRPLPWIFFLALLITLRVTRESISLINLAMGKPPLRSADVVMYIQSKRRYLRTLKYQGNRVMRARTSTGQPQQSWYNRIQALFDFTMCFRNSHNYGNNNTTCVSNNDEVLVVKRSKRGRQPTAVGVASAVAAAETTMDRLIEKMMQDLDADTDDDSSFTLTNVTSVRSDRSDTPESDQDSVLHYDGSTPRKSKTSDTDSNTASNNTEQPTPKKIESPKKESDVTEKEEHVTADVHHESADDQEKQINNETLEQQDSDESSDEEGMNEATAMTREDAALQMDMSTPPRSAKEESQLLIQQEGSPYQRQHSPSSDHKNVNGQIQSSPSNKKGLNVDQREYNPNNISM